MLEMFWRKGLRQLSMGDNKETLEISTLKRGRSKSYVVITDYLVAFILSFNGNLELYIR